MAVCDVKYAGDSFSLSYIQKNMEKKRVVLFLHGWGSNKEIMQNSFANSLVDFRHIYVDMPGFGASANETVLTTFEYAEIIKAFLKVLEVNTDIVAGHSFGGKVATLLNPKCLVLLSSAGILVPKPLSVRLKIRVFKMLKPFKMGALRKFFVADDAKMMNQAMYETFKNIVNEEFEENFKRLNSQKVLLFWGKSDSATPLWTAKKIADDIGARAKLYALDGDHFFFLKHAKFICETISKQCRGLDE